MTLDVRFQFISLWALNNREAFKVVLDESLAVFLTEDIAWHYDYFCSNNYDGRIWAFLLHFVLVLECYLWKTVSKQLQLTNDRQMIGWIYKKNGW